ncbi:MAG: GTPase Era [Chitinophagales bacterium]|jgi:GTP-binding protein Era|nr:GTPase Era [Chitinophagales bacterium]
MNQTYKAGFVNIIGKPNVGKSTLMNALVGEQLSIITYKAQTTRHRIMGVVNGTDWQIVYSDTPGMVDNPGYKMHEAMNRFVQTALHDADVVLILLDATNQQEKASEYAKRLQKISAPVLILLNKCDAVSEDKANVILAEWQKDFPTAVGYYRISALKNQNLEPILPKIIDLLPFHPPYYDEETLTDRPVRFFIAEIIREKILLLYADEIPYSVEVVIDEYKESPEIDRIRAIIVTNRPSQKPILIGKNGAMLKKVGTQARLTMEAFLEKKVFLELFVKVKENWRNDEQFLQSKGYEV